MGLATIDAHSQKSTPRFTKSPSLVLIRLVLTEIQAFKNVKNLQRNVWKCGQIRTKICPHFHTLLCKFLTFLNACISVKHIVRICPHFHTFLCKSFTFLNVSQSKLAWLTPNLGILWISVCSFWLRESIVANPIIYRLVPSPSRYEIRQLSHLICFNIQLWFRAFCIDFQTA